MSVFIDSSVMVAAFAVMHPHYEPSRQLLASCDPSSSAACTHSLAEIYSAVTRLPLSPRPLPEHAMRFIRSIERKMRWIALERDDYLATLEICAARGLRGGKIYDVLLLQAALKTPARLLYTWNRRDFDPLAVGTDITVRTPDDVL